MGKRAIYSCITLQKELENTIKKIGFDGKVTYLNVALHSNPQKMHETLQRIIDENTEAEVEAYIMPLVKLLGGRLTRLIGSYKVLEKLVSGKYDESVIAIPKGETLSIHEFDGLRPCTIKK